MGYFGRRCKRRKLSMNKPIEADVYSGRAAIVPAERKHAELDAIEYCRLQLSFGGSPSSGRACSLRPITFKKAIAPLKDIAWSRHTLLCAHHVTPEQACEVFARTKPKLAVYSHMVVFMPLSISVAPCLTSLASMI